MKLERTHIINDDLFKTNEIEPNSIDLIITSPPYNLGIDYNSTMDLMEYDAYLDFSRRWMTRCF